MEGHSLSMRRLRGGAVIAALLLLMLQACTPIKSGNDACKGETAETWRLCGDTAREKGDYARAVADYDQALRLEPDYVPALTNRGVSHNALGDYDAAIRDFTEVIRLHPEALGAYTNRSRSYFRKGDLQAAIDDLRECQRREPTYGDAHYNLGYYFLTNDRLDEALASFTTAILYYGEAAARPPSVRVSGWFNEDRFYARKARPESDLRNIDVYLADAYYWRARTYLRLHALDKANADLAAARDIDADVERRNEGAK